MCANLLSLTLFMCRTAWRYQCPPRSSHPCLNYQANTVSLKTILKSPSEEGAGGHYPHPIASCHCPYPHLLVFLLPLGRGHPVARNTFEMGISCSLGQQGLRTASARDRNSLLRQRRRGRRGRVVSLGALWGGVLLSSSLPLLHTNPEEVLQCRGCRGHESS